MLVRILLKNMFKITRKKFTLDFAKTDLVFRFLINFVSIWFELKLKNTLENAKKFTLEIIKNQKNALFMHDFAIFSHFVMQNETHRLNGKAAHSWWLDIGSNPFGPNVVAMNEN